MEPSGLSDSYVVARRRGVRVAKAKFRVGQHVCISEEKMNFAKRAEQNLARRYFESRR